MDLRRLGVGEYVTAAFGVLLVLSLFGPWYDVRGIDLTAWQAFAITDVLLVLSGLLGIGLLVLTAVQRTAAVGITSDTLLLIVGGIVAVIALFRFLNLPGAADEINAGRTLFVAAVGVAAGALLSMRDERLSKPDRPTDERSPTSVPRGDQRRRGERPRGREHAGRAETRPRRPRSRSRPGRSRSPRGARCRGRRRRPPAPSSARDLRNGP